MVNLFDTHQGMHQSLRRLSYEQRVPSRSTVLFFRCQGEKVVPLLLNESRHLAHTRLPVALCELDALICEQIRRVMNRFILRLHLVQTGQDVFF